MRHHPQLPLIMWVPAAVLLHLMGGGSAFVAADHEQQRADLLAFTQQIGRTIERATRTTNIEVVSLPPPERPPEDQASRKADETRPSDSPPSPPDPQQAPQIADTPPAPKPKPRVAKSKTKPPEPKKTKKAPAKKKVAKKKEPAKKTPPGVVKAVPIKPKRDSRLAVINDPSLDKKQPDNPDAKRIADHANKTKRERMARIRSYDQNQTKPTAAGKRAKVAPAQPGNADTNDPGFSTKVDPSKPDEAPRAGGKRKTAEPSSDPANRNMNAPPKRGSEAVAARSGTKGRAAGKGAIVPDATSGKAGGWRIDPGGGDGRKKQASRSSRRARKGRAASAGSTSGSLPKRFSIDAHGLQQALGKDYLKRDQEKARNTRIAKHRGRFAAADFKRFRAAIENYDPSVQAGNQTSLNAARVPFASYINRMHNRIHPIFADRFLRSLGQIDGAPELQNMKLVSHLELVLDPKSGKLLRFGVVKPSGVTAFDVAALRSVEQAAPFGKTPRSIVSPGDKVYIHWEFYRNPYYACTSRFARPFMLRHPPDMGKRPRKKLPAPLSPPDTEETKTGWLPLHDHHHNHRH